MTTQGTTRLEAVNIMLSVIGERPVNALGAGTPADVAMAENILDEVDKEVQSRGWHFNTEIKVTLDLDGNNEVPVPLNIARLDVPANREPSVDITVREQKLYDLKDHTFTFTRSIDCDVIYLLPWTDLPESAKNFILTRAARQFQDRVMGAIEHHQYNLRDEFTALADLKEHEGETGDHSIFSEWSVARAVARQSPLDHISPI